MKKQNSYEQIILLITFFVHLIIYPLILLAIFLAYFILKNNVSATVEFFLRWTCISILAVLVGYFLQSTIFSRKEDSSNIKYIPIYIVAIIQSLVLAYLFAVYQPNPDQMSHIHILSWILFVTVIHIFWVQGNPKNSFYSLIGQSFGIDSTKFTKLITVLSTLGAIGVWIAIAAIMVKQ